MKHESVIHVTNSDKNSKTFVLEPWGEEFEMLSGKKFELFAKAEREGNFEVELTENKIIVYAWSGSTVKIFCEGEELGVGNYERSTVPEVPDGQNVSTFVGFMFGKDN